MITEPPSVSRRYHLVSISIFVGLLGVGGAFCPLPELHAERVILSVDPSQSVIDLELQLLGTTLPGQGEGSTSSSFTGLIAVDVDSTGAPTSLEILGSDFRASVTGDWLPDIGGGTLENSGPAAPGNYGYVIDLGDLGTGIGYVAFRNLAYNIWNPSGPVSVSNGDFSSISQKFDISSGSWAVNLPPSALNDGMEIIFDDSIVDDPEDGEFNFPDSGNGLSSYAVTGSEVKLTIPIDILEQNTTTDFISIGTLVATANLSRPVTADFDQDGDSDGNDFLHWQRGYGLQGTAVVSDGDGNGDGNVDERDLTLWETLDAFVAGLPNPTPGVAVIPEPTSGLLAGIATLGAVCRSTRRR